MSPEEPQDPRDALPAVLVALLKGVVYQEGDVALWQSLLTVQARVREYVAVLGLELFLDESEGHAYLRQRALVEGEPALPRLVPRRPLTWPVSLLLALLRKKMAELDAKSGETRLIVSRDEIVELVRVFLPATGNEARLIDRIDAHIEKVVQLGFVRRLRGREDLLEVRRILKAFVDAQWLQQLDDRLAAYRAHAAADLGEGAERGDVP